MIPANRSSYSFMDGKCWQLQDPVKGPPERGGSIWPTFADAYGKPMLIANLAVSGSSIRLWNGAAQQHKVRAALGGLRRAGYRPIVVWMNGETDASANMSAAEYYRRMRLLAVVTGDAPWFIVRESRCYERSSKYPPLDEARDRFVADDPARYKLGPDLDRIPDGLRQKDACHLSRQGQIVFGRLMARSFTAAWPG